MSFLDCDCAIEGVLVSQGLGRRSFYQAVMGLTAGWLGRNYSSRSTQPCIPPG